MYDIDYSKMEWDPTVKKPLAEAYPKINQIFGQKVNDKSLRYVIAMYDQKSPIKDVYPELGQRKKFSAAAAGVNLDKEEKYFKELSSLTVEVKTVIRNADGDKIGSQTTIEPYDEVLDLISKFVIYQNNRVWTMIITNENAFYEYQKRIMAEIGGDADKDALTAITIKTKLMEAMDQIHSRLQGYYRELYGEDEDLVISMSKRKRVTAENQATR